MAHNITRSKNGKTIRVAVLSWNIKQAGPQFDSKADVLSLLKPEFLNIWNTHVWDHNEGRIYREFDSNLCWCFKQIIYFIFEVPVFE